MASFSSGIHGARAACRISPIRNAGALSPLAVLTGFLAGGGLSAFLAWWLASWFAGGVGMFFLGRHLRAPWWGSFAVALGYLFSGFYLGHAEHISWIHSYSFLPLGDLVVRSGIARSEAIDSPRDRGAVRAVGSCRLSRAPDRHGRDVALVGVGTRSRSTFSGPGTIGEIGIVDVLATCLRRALVHLSLVALCRRRHPGPGVRRLLHRRSRLQHPDRVRRMVRASPAISSNALHPGAFVSFASPWASEIQLQSGSRFWAGTDVSSCSVYVGPLIPFLALVALHRPAASPVAMVARGFDCTRAGDRGRRPVAAPRLALRLLPALSLLSATPPCSAGSPSSSPRY